ncbi:MAG: hypothetical protein GPJ54_04680 [Candidatus Heimdallarchaeota archaeon]|nr:hypothetical protein [Candidatus Heimdallarchaeota archaeon]
MDAMEIAEEFAPLFQSKIQDKDGNIARYISVHNIDYTQKSHSNIVEYTLDIHFLSDQGELFQSLWIREFANSELMKQELDGYYETVDVCINYPDINLYPLLKVDQERNLLIYEKPKGFNLDRLGMSDELKYFILGRIYGVLHGKDLEPLDHGTLQEFLSFLINHLPFTDDEKKSVQNLVERDIIKHRQNYGGLIPQMLIRPVGIVFQLEDSKKNLDKETVSTTNNITANIRYEVPDKLTIDRMSDAGYIFYKKAFQEFQKTGKLDYTKSEISYFFAGYSDALISMKLPSLAEIYPIDNTINLQILFVAWLREVEKLQIGALEPHTDRDLIQFSYYLLTENPFVNIFIDE